MAQRLLGPVWRRLRLLVSRGVLTLVDDSLGFLEPGTLEGLTCPVQLIRGSETHPVIGVINDVLAARLPEAENKIIAGAGHMVPITHAAQTATEIRAFFDRYPA